MDILIKNMEIKNLSKPKSEVYILISIELRQLSWAGHLQTTCVEKYIYLTSQKKKTSSSKISTKTTKAVK